MRKALKIGVAVAALAVAGGGATAYLTWFHIPSNPFDGAAWRAQGPVCGYSLWMNACTRFTMVDDLTRAHPVGSSATEAFAALTHPAEAPEALQRELGRQLSNMLDVMAGALQGGQMALDGETLRGLSTITARYPIQKYSTGFLSVTYDFEADKVVAYDLRDRDVSADWYREQVANWSYYEAIAVPFDAAAWRTQRDACIGTGAPSDCNREAMLADLVLTHGPVAYFGKWQQADIEALLGPADEVASFGTGFGSSDPPTLKYALGNGRYFEAVLSKEGTLSFFYSFRADG